MGRQAANGGVSAAGGGGGGGEGERDVAMHLARSI